MNRSKTNLVLTIILVQIVAISAVYLPNLGFYFGAFSLLPATIIVGVPIMILESLDVTNDYIGILFFLIFLALLTWILVKFFASLKYLIQ